MYVKNRKLILLSVVCVVCTLVQHPVFAYTSTLNPQHPATAPDSYVINIPDANLKAALNQIIANVSPVSTRTPDQSITVKDAKRVSLMYWPQSLNAKGITNLEGIQYFTNVNSLYVVNNTPNITDTPLNIRPLQALKKLKTLIISRNNLPQNLLEEVIPHLTLLETLDIARNRATDLTPLLTPLNNLRALTLEGNKFTTLDALITKTGLTYLNLNANTLSNTEIQKLWVLTNLKTLLISAILPANTFSDLSFLASLNQLEDLRLNNNRAITTLESALASKNTLKRLEIINNELSEDVLPQVAQFTNVTEIRAGGNKLYDISSLASLHQITEASKSSFPDQVATKTTLTQVLPNPIKNRDGSIVPVTETADVINVDASGTPDQNGGYIKVNKEGQGTVTVNWKAPVTSGLHQNFSGILTINYNINLTPPTVTVTSPANITATNATNYTVSGTCSEIGKPVTVTIGTLSPFTVNCEAGGTYSKNGIDASSLPEGNVAITASQTNASNIEGKAEVTVQKDTTPPTATITPSTTNPTQGPVTLTLESNEPIQTPLGWTEVPGSNGTKFTKDVTENGEISVTITDTAGNPQPTPITYNVTNIDTTWPDITVNNPDTTPAQNKTISATATDGNITGYTVVPAGTPCDDTLTYTAGNSVTLSDESDNGNIVCFKAVDTLGNASFKASNPVSGIDTSWPIFSNEPTGSLNPETESITFNIPHATDPAGVSKYHYKIKECDGNGDNCTDVVASTEIPHNTGNTSETITFPNPKKDQNRKYILKVRAEDALGNLSDEQDAIIDTEVLEIKFQAGDNGSISPTNSQKIFDNAPFSKITLPTPTPNPGYKFKNWTNNLGQNPPTNPTTPITTGTTYTANFEIDQDQKIWNYTVNYYLKNTTNPVPGISRNEDTGNAYIGEIITITPPSAPTGYKLTSGQSTSFPVNQNNTIKNIYYEVDNDQTFSYTINYTKASTVIETLIQEVPKANPVVNASDIPDKTPKGYKLDTANSTNFPHTVSSDNENITVAYIVDTSDAGKVFDYEIFYIEEATVSTIHASVSGQWYIWEQITAEHFNIPGYVVNPNQATTLTVLEQNTPTTLTIFYKKDTDNDGIPDDTDEDDDNDGVSDAEETQHNSNPKDPNSKPNKYDYEPTVQNLTKAANAPKLTEDDVKNAITNKDTFPANTQITLDPSINLSTLQDTAGDKEVELIVTYPDGSKDTVKVKIKVEVANNNTGGNNNGNNNWNSSSSSWFSGWGGGWASLIRDHCPHGDHSPSYYDNSCGNTSNQDQTQDQNPDPQSPAIPTDNEMIDAYKRAFENGITTQATLADARLLDYLTRAELAKMLSIFTLKYTERQPILDKPFCDTYTDADQVNAELSSFMTTACKLEIMGLHSDGKTPLDAFMPNKHVSRAELVTVLSRVLYGNQYDNNTADRRWQGHMDKLHTDTVIKDPTPTIQEIRAYVLLMMYRIKGK